jgi:hypothetical protein
VWYDRVLRGCEVADFGLCTSSQDRCGLSVENHALDRLLRLLQTLEAKRLAGSNADVEVPIIAHFREFFQTDVNCQNCGSLLARVTQPTSGLPREGEEYIRRSRMNQIFDAGYKMQAEGIIPA